MRSSSGIEETIDNHRCCFKKFLVRDPTPSDNQNKDLVVFYVTGNPGGLDFYVEFARVFVDNLSKVERIRSRYETITLYSIGHANHHLLDPGADPLSTDFKCYNLQDQINHQYNYLSTCLQSHGGLVDVMLCGHSIGCYILLALLDSYPHISSLVTDLVLFMPFIIWKNLPIDHRFSLTCVLLAQHLTSVALHAAMALYWNIPQLYRRKIIESATTLNDSFKTMVADRLLTLRMIKNFLCMGVDEIRDVALHQEHNLNVLRTLTETRNCVGNDTSKGGSGIRITAIYTNDDKWAPVADGWVLRDSVPGISVHYVPNVTHAFTVLENGREAVCSVLLRALNYDSDENADFPDCDSRSMKSSLLSLLILSTSPLMVLLTKKGLERLFK